MPTANTLPNQRQAITLNTFALTSYVPNASTSKRSWRLDRDILRRHILPVLGNRRLLHIARKDVERWLQKMLQSNLKPSTCNRALAVLRSLFAFAERQGLVDAGRSPCRGVSPLRLLPARERFLSAEEAHRLRTALQARPDPEAKALLLLMLTGARKREILHARWEHVHADRRLLIVPLSKSNKARHIPLSAKALEVLASLPRNGEWLFPGRDGNRPLHDIYLWWNKLRQELGLEDVRIHDLRHSFASMLVNKGHTLYQVQQVLGHADPRTTMRYAHFAPDTLLAAAESVSHYLEQSREPKVRTPHRRRMYHRNPHIRLRPLSRPTPA